MSMTRWDPFRDMLSLREAMQQLMEESFVRPSTMRGGGAQQLALDVHEEDNAYVVRASLPGYKPEDIQVNVLGDTLTIRAERKGEAERTQGNYLVRERHAGTVQRSFSLPAQIDSNAVEADYEHGVLTLTLPKSPAAQPRRIQIRAAGGVGRDVASQGQQGITEPGMAALNSTGQGMGTANTAGQTAPNQGTDQTAQRGEQAGRLPSLEEQTPGLDTAQERRMSDDARAYYGQGQDRAQSQGQTPAEAQNPMQERGENPPPSGDVRTIYTGDRAPGEPEPTEHPS
jgi:HSP20 family protein